VTLSDGCRKTTVVKYFAFLLCYEQHINPANCSFSVLADVEKIENVMSRSGTFDCVSRLPLSSVGERKSNKSRGNEHFVSKKPVFGLKTFEDSELPPGIILPVIKILFSLEPSLIV
jgi:hypothetical protein